MIDPGYIMFGLFLVAWGAFLHMLAFGEGMVDRHVERNLQRWREGRREIPDVLIFLYVWGLWLGIVAGLGAVFWWLCA